MEMAGAYNRYLTKNALRPNNSRISKSDDFIQIKNNKKYLLSELIKRFEKTCGNDELCITKQTFMNELVKEMRDEIIEETFRATGPNDPSEWLSTFDIDNILTQYQNVYSDFLYLGAVPLDCGNLSFCSLYQVDFDKYYKDGTNYLGVVFNLDKHGQPGSHWVALYVDLKNGEINYCDSNGKGPLDDVVTIIDQFRDYYKKRTDKHAVYQFNKIPYQKDGSECGVYSSNFIIRRLSGEKFENIVQNYLTFKDINSCRNVYFNNKTSKYQPHPKCDL